MSYDVLFQSKQACWGLGINICLTFSIVMIIDDGMVVPVGRGENVSTNYLSPTTTASSSKSEQLFSYFTSSALPSPNQRKWADCDLLLMILQLLTSSHLHCDILELTDYLVQVAKEGIQLPSDKALCPLCSEKRANPSVVTVSGFIFCYGCIFKYVSQVRHYIHHTVQWYGFGHGRKTDFAVDAVFVSMRPIFWSR